MLWPASLEEIKFSGAEICHVVLLDSSDGALIATEHFFDDARVRSNFQVKVHAVADHDQRPYGKFLPDNLFSVVVDGLAFCATLNKEVGKSVRVHIRPEQPPVFGFAFPDRRLAMQRRLLPLRKL